MKKIGKWVLPAIAVSMTHGALAMDLDWTGDFRTEAHWVKNYSMNEANPSTGGYSIPRGPSDPAQFQTLFMRLKPKVLVNDNVSIRSELWMGTPSGGFFGDAGGGATSARHLRTYDSTFSGGATLSAQRFWLEALTDVGNLQVGRAPLNWGLGLVWNSGDGLWDRYASTGDVIRMVSKFGAFSFIPSSVKYTLGDRLAGSTGVSDYSLALKYENADEGFEGGVNFIRRLGGAGNSVYLGSINAGGFNYTTWDIFVRKKLSKFELGAEAPIVTGKMGGAEYSSFAIAGEGKYQLNDSWQFSAKAGKIPGQPAGATDRYKAIFLNPNYRLGSILFGYALQNLGQAGTTADAFYSPVTNANYLQLGGQYSTGKWQWRGSWLMASASETAAATGSYFNQWSRQVVAANNSGVAQESSYGSEFDFGASLQWDDNLEFKADAAIFMPGGFYKFNDAGATQNQTGTVLGMVLGVGARF
jgi:hypothetical protein